MTPTDDAEAADEVRFVPGHYAELPIGDLEPHPKNANEGDLGALSESVDRVGFYGLVYVQDKKRTPTGKYRIVAGEHRYLTLLGKGAEKCPCWVMDLDDEEAFVVLVGDNRHTRLGRDDPTKVYENVVELAATPAGLPGSGFDFDDMEQLRRDAERDLASALAKAPPPPPADPDPERGAMGLLAECPRCRHTFRLGHARDG